jgi:hypothetical protein
VEREKFVTLEVEGLINVRLNDQLKSLMAILYFLAEEPVRNDEQQDCCLIVEVHAPDWINEELVQLATEEAIEDTFGKRLTLWSANQDEASQHLQAAPDATHGYLEFWAGAPLFWYLLRIV